MGTQDQQMTLVGKELKYHQFLIEKIEDIYFFDVNNKYISLSVLKTSDFSQVC